MLIVTLALPSAARGQDERYRVEVLVLLQLQHAEAGEETERLRDYSGALDFLTPVPEPEPLPPGCEPEPDELPEDESADVQGENLELATGEPIDGIPAEGGVEVDGVETELAIDPNAVVHVSEMGPEMQEAWRRLRLSGPFRPLQYLAWEQGSVEPFPSLRIHDDEVVFEDDPYADLREAESELDAIYGDDDIQPAQDDPDAEEILPDCNPPQEDPLPDPTLYYGLDGSVSLLRSRFLHLYLDLQLREPATVFPTASAGEPLHALVPGDFGRDETATANTPPPLYRVYDLAQKRQVRSGRMEYFDSPVLGVLAWITPIELEEPPER